ncbi:MAG: methylmalonyl Co-A mutase-associated GTPase MeaB [Sporichthyaceae bacterium]
MSVDVDNLVARARAGERRAVGRLISLVEDGSPLLREVMAALVDVANRAHVIGLTGPPGVGKSTTTSALVAAYRGAGRRVGVLAIDPTSPYSGGALLGDRIRMSEHADDDEVFIRSMAARGHLGGLSGAAPQALRVLEAAGCQVVLMETVGVGQSEVEIAAQADTTLVLVAPGMGDGIQAAKAGVLEIADVYVVNKADRDGADQAARQLTHMLAMGTERPGGWQAPVLKTVASRDEGITELVDTIATHWAHLAAGNELERRRGERAASEIEAIALAAVRARIAASPDRAALAAQVVAGDLDPYVAADRLLGGITD